MKTIKKILMTIAVLLCSVAASAYDFVVDGIFYNVKSAADLTAEVTQVTRVGAKKYSGDVVIPSTTSYKSKTLTVTSIGNNAFRDCRGLTSVTIPNSVTSIGDYAFSGCRGLTSVTIGNGVTNVGDSVFSTCDNITKVTLSCAVGSWFSGKTSIKEAIIDGNIGYHAFSGCSGLTSVTIGNGVRSIGTGAFKQCTSLKNLRIEDDYKTLFLGYNVDKREGMFSDCPIETLYLGRDINYDTTGKYDFCNPFSTGTTLKNLVIGDSVTKIGNFAFYACDGLTSVTIPNSVTSIGCYAFRGCSGLTSVTIGNGVRSIEHNAFEYCNSLKSIYLIGRTPPKGNNSIFTNSPYMDATLYVPQGTLVDYQFVEPWKSFWDIQEYDATTIKDVNYDIPYFEITVDGIQLTAVEGKAIAIYAANGALVEKIDCYAGETISLDNGVYVVRVGNKTIKVKL